MVINIKDDINPTAIVESPVGFLQIITSGDHLIGIGFSNAKNAIAPQCAIAKEVFSQLTHYFRNANFIFDLPIQLNVSEHQQRALSALQLIPCGDTRCYGDIAKELKSSARAIGNACRRNPIPIIIPCHRIIAKNGIGGFSGTTKGHMINIKQWLLNHEIPPLTSSEMVSGATPKNIDFH